MADEDYFVTVPIETDSQTLAQRGIDNLRAKWPNWSDDDGDLGTVQFQSIAPMAADAAVAASRMFLAAFRTFGTKLADVPYGTGSPATTTVSFHFTDALGHRVPEGFEVDIDGYAFAVEADVDVAAGVDTVSGVVVTATVMGAEQNDLMGDSVVPIGSLSYVEDVVLDSPTDGGSDPEDDPSFQSRLVVEQRLKARTLVTPPNFEADALQEPGIGRALVIKDNARNFTAVFTDDAGEPVSQAIKDRVNDRWLAYRQVNTTFNMPDATYTDIDLAGTIVAYPGFDKADLLARINELLASWLAPGVWGRPKNFGDIGSSTWYNENTVRRNKIIDLIGDVTGVNYVGGDLTINGAAADFVLPGTVALTRPGNFAGLVIA